jgi:hypothetical protein
MTDFDRVANPYTPPDLSDLVRGLRAANPKAALNVADRVAGMIERKELVSWGFVRGQASERTSTGFGISASRLVNRIMDVGRPDSEVRLATADGEWAVLSIYSSPDGKRVWIDIQREER